MAPTPTIPTSFVPKQPVRSSVTPQRSGGNIFMVAAMILLGIALLGSIGVFAYERYLMSVRDDKAAEVAAAETLINPATVEDFIRTRDRSTAAQTLLDTHVAASQFFDVLERLTLASVRFDELTFLLLNDRSAEIQMTGVARTFNALAAQSSAFASEKRIKSAIFSGITVNTNNTVSFSLDADLDPRLLVLTLEDAPLPAAPAAEESVLPVETAPVDTPATTPAATPTAEPAPEISL